MPEKSNIKNKKSLKKEYDKRRKIIPLSFNSSELSLLEKDMKTAGASVISAYIKFKLFGLEPEEKFQTRLNSITKEDDVKSVLKNEFEELNNQLDYINLKTIREIEEIEKEQMKDKRLLKKLNLLINIEREVSGKTDKLFLDCQTILKRMEIIVERKREDELRSMPQSMIDEFVRQGYGTNTPEMKEASRRLWEQKRIEQERKSK